MELVEVTYVNYDCDGRLEHKSRVPTKYMMDEDGNLHPIKHITKEVTFKEMVELKEKGEFF